MTDTVYDKITIARIGLLMRHPFFGNMATRLKIVDGSDWCSTAATNGREIFYNREFFETKTNKEIEFIIAHEIWHNVLDHINRLEGRNPKVWNAAIDYATNGMLIRDRIGEKPKGIEIYHDVKHNGKSAEEIYDEIYEDEVNKQPGLQQLLDEHIDWASPSKDNQPGLTREEISQIKDEMREAMIAAAQTAGAGNVPAEVQRVIKQLTEPKLDWRQVLRQQIQSTVRNDYSWSRPSRKGWHSGAVLPGMQFDESIEVCVAIDTSGSISDSQVQDFLSEVSGIMETYRDYSIKVWCFDTSTHNFVSYEPHNGEDIAEYKPAGGGGTDFTVNWKLLKHNDIVPKMLILFTDMYPCGSWGDPDYCPTIFVAHGTKEITAPFGTTVFYDE